MPPPVQERREGRVDMEEGARVNKWVGCCQSEASQSHGRGGGADPPLMRGRIAAERRAGQ